MLALAGHRKSRSMSSPLKCAMLYKMLAANPHVIERMLQSVEQED